MHHEEKYTCSSNNDGDCALLLRSSARFTKHLKPMIFVSTIYFVWSLQKSLALDV